MTQKKYIITADDVEDNLTSTLQDVPLSANQGRILNTGKVDKNQGTSYAGKVLGIGADGLVYPVSMGGGAHASTHATGGSDPITPASIGACSNTDSRLSDARTPLAHNQAASTITSGTLSADRLPKASTSAFGAVKVGSGLSVSGGVISASGGGVKTITNVATSVSESLEESKVFFPAIVSGTIGLVNHNQYREINSSYTVHRADGTITTGEVTIPPRGVVTISISNAMSFRESSTDGSICRFKIT